MPSRIDLSVFENTSSSVSYSIISSLKYLSLIKEDGIPTQEFIALVNASDDERVGRWRKIMMDGYPSLFSSDVDLTTLTAAKFDDHCRTEFGVSGSTVDKVALFFIAGAKAADISLSPLLLNRKPVAPSNTTKKSARQRKRGHDGGDDDVVGRLSPLQATKALEYQLIDLMSQRDVNDEVKKSIWSLVQYLAARKAVVSG